jgi:hypothetical protein
MGLSPGLHPSKRGQQIDFREVDVWAPCSDCTCIAVCLLPQGYPAGRRYFGHYPAADKPISPWGGYKAPGRSAVARHDMFM